MRVRIIPGNAARTEGFVNGLIRRLYSRQSSFAGIGEVELDHIERFLNDRPRKRLGWKTPREEMSGFPCFRPLEEWGWLFYPGARLRPCLGNGHGIVPR